MSIRTKKQQYFLDFIKNCESYRQRKLILLHANRSQILALAEIVLNFLHGGHTLDENDRRVLYNYRNFLRILGSKRMNWKTRRQAAIRSVRVIPRILRFVEGKYKDVNDNE